MLARHDHADTHAAFARSNQGLDRERIGHEIGGFKIDASFRRRE